MSRFGDIQLPPGGARGLILVLCAGVLALAVTFPPERVIGLMFAADGQDEQAVKFLSSWNARHPRDFDARWRTAQLLMQTVHPDEAVRTLEAMARDFNDDPDLPKILTQLVQIEDSRFNDSASGAWLERLAKAAPKDKDVAQQLADRYRWRGETEKLVQALRHVVSLGDFPDERRELAAILLAARRYDEIIAWFAHTDGHSGDATTHLMLYEAYLRKGRVDEAASELHHVVDLEPESIDHVHDLANLLEQHGRYDEVIALYRERISRDPRSAAALATELDDLYESYVAQLTRRGRFKDAVALMRERIASDPKNLSLRVGLAELYGPRADAVAVEQLTELTAHDPKSAPAWAALAERLSWTGSPRSADAWATAVRLQPGSAAYQRSWAEELIRYRRLDEARAVVGQLAKRNEASGANLGAMAELELDAENPKEALRLASDWKSAEPRSAPASRLFARAALAAAQPALALAEMTVLTGRNPRDAEAQHLLADAAIAVGDPDRALRALHTADRLGGRSR
jgi:predicted Zn-dependent protease